MTFGEAGAAAKARTYMDQAEVRLLRIQALFIRIQALYIRIPPIFGEETGEETSAPGGSGM